MIVPPSDEKLQFVRRFPMNRREALAATAVGLGAVAMLDADEPPVNPKGRLKITKLETFLVQPRWLFLKVHTDAGIVGLGEPVVEGRAETVADGGQGDRAVPRRQGPAAGRAPLAGDLPPRLLPRRPGAHQRPQRHRHGAVGHQGQGARRAGLRAARRADPHRRSASTPTPARRPTIKQGRRRRVHRVQDRPAVPPHATRATSRRRRR